MNELEQVIKLIKTMLRFDNDTLTEQYLCIIYKTMLRLKVNKSIVPLNTITKTKRLMELLYDKLDNDVYKEAISYHIEYLERTYICMT
jgi:hypothetical protein